MVHAPETEACHHRSVRAPQGRCVRVLGEVEAVAFGQLRWSVCFSQAALNVTLRLPPDQTLIHPSAWKKISAKLDFRITEFYEVSLFASNALATQKIPPVGDVWTVVTRFTPFADPKEIRQLAEEDRAAKERRKKRTVKRALPGCALLWLARLLV